GPSPWLPWMGSFDVVLLLIASVEPRRGGKRRRLRIVVTGEFLLGGLDPGGEFLITHHQYGDRHEGVILATQLGALPVIFAFPGGLEPGLVEASRHRVDLDPKRGHRERVDDAGGVRRHDDA